MSARRIAQVNALIQQTLGEILLKEFDSPLGALLTITKVETSADRDHANVWVSIYPDTQAAVLFDKLQRQRGGFQHLLNQVLVMEHVPSIHWKHDVGEAEAAKIEAIIDSVSTEHE